MTFIRFPLSDKFSSDVLLCLPTSAHLTGRENEPTGSLCLEEKQGWIREEEEEDKDSLKIIKSKKVSNPTKRGEG